ncbi:MAG: methyl-accepting chemotaxis protein [Treponema sp.]|nr:methyl-accepting chemotaxis protein [Treponema sp.]
MFFLRLKISTKLIISSAVFLIPIGVMLFFIYSMTLGKIQKSVNEHEGIKTIKPAVLLMQNLPTYFNVYLGLEQGNLRILDGQITDAVRLIDRRMERYNTDSNIHPGLLSEWEALKNTARDDDNIYQKYLDFVHLLRDTIHRAGESSSLILVSDMDTYYFIDLITSSIPEASIRLISIGNSLRQNLNEAEEQVTRWNNDLAAAHEQGRRLNTMPFEDAPGNITMTMLISADLQLIRNSRFLIESDKDKINNSIRAATDGVINVADEYYELLIRLDRYMERTAEVTGILSVQQSRQGAAAAVSTVSESLNAISSLNTDLCQLWNESFSHLEIQIQRNTAFAQRQLALYLLIVFVSLGIAIGFVILITSNINRSVKNLRTLFKSLNENDLTLSLQVNSMDEFGELMTAFNGFINILRSTFGSFKQSTQLVADSVFDISTSSKEITTTANEQSASVSEIVSTMESCKNLSEQAALKTTEVANLAMETQELSSKGAELREANQIMMEDIRNQNQNIISEIRSLSDMIIRISEAIRIIDSVADQTKLIAFNASLEASASGEAGTRFAVVAAEIRRFADNVVDSTRQIKQKIEEVQYASQTLIAKANNGSRQIEIGYERMSEQKIVFENIVENSQNVATRSQQISNLSKQQEMASSQIFIALKEISVGVKQFVIATSSTSKTADNLKGMSEELKGKVEKYKTSNEASGANNEN